MGIGGHATAVLCTPEIVDIDLFHIMSKLTFKLKFVTTDHSSSNFFVYSVSLGFNSISCHSANIFYQ